MVSRRTGGDTIFALSSAPGRAGIAVVRLSGPLVKTALQDLTRRNVPAPRRATLREFFVPTEGPIDQGIVLFFPAPASYTGEDVAELHLHGGRAVLAQISDVLISQELRPAEPGEFTRRAVENGKLDLTRAEAIADLIDAETEAQRRQAFSQYSGHFERLCDAWRRQLIRCAAWAEAAIDFSDEELPEDLLAKSRSEASALAKELQVYLRDERRGEILREGLHLTVIGPPNAGKSSLVNALAQRDVAIVAETAGTTRDVIEVRLDLGGYPVIVSDTAGLRQTAEAVESEGVRRALARAEAADLVLLLLDGSSPEEAGTLGEAARNPDLVVWNKADLRWPSPRSGLRLSLRTGEGLAEVVDAIGEAVRSRLDRPREPAVLTRARHRQSLVQAAQALERAASAANPELIAEDLRLATRAIGRISACVDVEDLLDVIFRDFCIGK
jgi:tRNA modification GTPase